MKVFISSTHTDLQVYRQKLKEALLEAGYQPVMPEIPDSVPLKEKKHMLHDLKKADVLLGVYAHRYGEMERGENMSLIEQEYRYALKLEKDIICCVVDPQIEWPQEHLEDDFVQKERLNTFLKEIKQLYCVNYFKSPTHLLNQIMPNLAQLSEKYDRLEKLASWSQKLRPQQKWNTITRLAEKNKKNKLSDAAFILTTQMIACDFKLDHSPQSYHLLNDIEALLKGETNIDNYTSKVNHQITPSMKQFIHSHTYLVLGIMTLFSLMLGLFLGLKSVRLNELPPPFQTTTASLLAPASGRPPLAIPEQPPEKSVPISPVDSSALSPVPPTLPLLPAVPILPLSPAVPALPLSPALPVLPSSPAPDTTRHKSILKKDSQAARMPVNPQFSFLKNDTLTLLESLEALQQFLTTLPPGSPKVEPVHQEIKRFKSLLESTASIRKSDHFVVCQHVDSQTRMPIGITNQFIRGKIWVWARINAPNPDTIRVEWYKNGQLFKTRTATISTVSPRYRIYFAQTYDKSAQELQEVRFYNSQNLLIGRKTFRIKKNDTIPIAQKMIIK